MPLRKTSTDYSLKRGHDGIHAPFAGNLNTPSLTQELHSHEQEVLLPTCESWGSWPVHTKKSRRHKSRLLAYIYSHFVAQPQRNIKGNRPYRLLTFDPMASFSCQVFTCVSCTIGLRTYLLLGLRSTRNQIVKETWEYNLHVHLSCPKTDKHENEAIGSKANKR
jgi:hypothetical protein